MTLMNHARQDHRIPPDILARSRARLATFGLPYPFDLKTFRQRLAAMNGRRLVLHPLVDGQTVDLTGARFSTADVDYVFYPTVTSKPHQDHVILRSLIRAALLDGQSMANSDLRKLMPNLALTKVRGTLGIDDEPIPSGAQHADMMATLVGELAVRPTLNGLTSPQKLLEELTPLWQSLVIPGCDTLVRQLDTAMLRLYRQVIEINEADLALRPYAQPRIDQLARSTARRAGHSTEMADAFVQAARLEAARLARQDQSTAFARAPAEPVAGTGYATEVHRLQRVAAAYRSAELQDLVASAV